MAHWTRGGDDGSIVLAVALMGMRAVPLSYDDDGSHHPQGKAAAWRAAGYAGGKKTLSRLPGNTRLYGSAWQKDHNEAAWPQAD